MISKRRMSLRKTEAIYRAARLKVLEELIQASDGPGQAVILRHQIKAERLALLSLLNEPNPDVDRWNEVDVVALRTEQGDFDLLVEGNMRPWLRSGEPWLFATRPDAAPPPYVTRFAWELPQDPAGEVLATHPVKEPFAIFVMNLVKWLRDGLAEIDQGHVALSDAERQERAFKNITAFAARVGIDETSEVGTTILKLFGPMAAEQRVYWVERLTAEPLKAGLAALAGILTQSMRWAIHGERAPRRRLAALRESIATMLAHLEEQLRHLAQQLHVESKVSALPVTWREESER
jgi:hypothetical protein